MRLLYADSDAQFSDRVSGIMRKQGFDVDIAVDSTTFFCYADFDIYDAIIICFNVSKGDEFSVLKELRSNKNNTPVLFLGQSRDIDELIAAFENGADDYLSKPFAFREFIVRVQALARRKPTTLEFFTMSYRDLTLNLNTNELLCNEKTIHLGVKEFQILKILIAQGNVFITKESLAEKVWGINSGTEYNNVEVYISFLRKKLKKISSCVTITSLRNCGYRLSTQ